MKNIIIGILLMPGIAFGANVSNTKIVRVAINAEYGDYAFIKLANAPERIQCSTNGTWDYTLPLTTETNRAMYSTILAAFMSGKTVNVYGLSSPDCNEFPHVESMNTIDVMM